MTLVKHDAPRHEMLTKSSDLFDRLFEDRLNFLRHPVLLWPEVGGELKVEEFKEDGALVIRAELAGIDPDSDVEISVEDQVLRIEASRREEEESKGRDYVRREFSYGSFSRRLPLPTGVTEADIQASYRDGILEVRIPLPTAKPSVKVPVTKG